MGEPPAGLTDWRGQAWSKDLGTPAYQVIAEKGPDHAKHFEIRVQLGDRQFKPCWGMSKKAAEQLAALEALLELGFAVRSEAGEVRLIFAA